MSTNKKREGINRFACDVSLYDAEKPKASMKYHKPPLPMILLGIVAYGFVGQPFSKQLYSFVTSRDGLTRTRRLFLSFKNNRLFKVKLQYVGNRTITETVRL